MSHTFLSRRAGIGATALLLVAAAIPVRAQQREPEKVPPFHTKLFVSDSMTMINPSMSPDGRWIAFATYQVGRSNIWVVPATGGHATQLTTGAHVDDQPRWFPSGDRIAFTSDRMKSILSIGFDRNTGRAVGTPKRITLEETSDFGISADGSKMAYLTETSPTGQRLLRVVAASGGPAVTVAELSAQTSGFRHYPTFSPDGRFIYFVHARAEQHDRVLVRVPATGGALETIGPPINARFPGSAVSFPVTAAQQLVIVGAMGDRGLVSTFAGDTVATFSLMKDEGLAFGAAIAADARSVVLVKPNVVAPVRLATIDGASRTIGEGRVYEWPVAWTPDGKRVLYSTDVPGWATVNVDGTGRRFTPLAPKNLAITVKRVRLEAFSPDLRYYGFAPDSQNGAKIFTYYVLDTRTNTVREIARRDRTITLVTAGGDWFGTNHGEFLYGETSGDRAEIRGVTPAGESRLIRSFPRAVANQTTFGVEGDRVAYQQVAGDSATLYTVRDSKSEPKAILTIRGRFQEIVWSLDARWIAASVFVSRDGAARQELAFIPVDRPAEARYIPLGDGGYAPVWTRDDSAVFFLKADKNWTQMSVWRYPLRADEAPTNLTQNETGNFWGYELSPDGRSVAMAVERSKGSTLWRVDLQQAALAYKAAKAKAVQAGKTNPE